MEDVTTLVSFVSPLGIVLVMVWLGFRFADRMALVLDKQLDQLWERIDRWLEGKENGRIS